MKWRAMVLRIPETNDTKFYDLDGNLFAEARGTASAKRISPPPRSLPSAAGRAPVARRHHTAGARRRRLLARLAVDGEVGVE